jgi:hypothetical protein
MQLLKPLAIQHIGLATRYILHMPCVDQHDFKAAGFQELIERDPIDTR